MNMNDYEKFAERTMVSELGVDASDQDIILAWMVLGLNGEAGEVADLVKKAVFHEHGLNKDKLCEEIGDVLWYAAAICKTIGISLADAMEYNINKLNKRYPAGFSSDASRSRGERE